MKKSCVIYDSWKDMIVSLPDEMAGELIKMILSYAFDGEQYPTDNPALAAMFNMISKKLDEDEEAWKEECKRRSEAGKKAMANRWNHNKTITEDKTLITNDNTLITENKNVSKTITTITESESVSDTESVSESVNESVNESVKDKKHIYGEYKHVRLTDKEHDLLINDYGEVETSKAIKYLDEYIEMKGNKYKSHYLAMKKWVFDAVRSRGQPQGIDWSKV
ncbi:MAG: hypothetical protein IKN47_07885 [Lachnospiraceae bacterium]|nr:hypothetical protein [Lachnospiraceae bacterium]